MQIIFSKLLNFSKNNWKILIIVLASVIVVWQINRIFSARQRAMSSQIDEIKKIHEDQIAKIKDAYDRELEQREQNIKQLSNDLQDSKKEYDALKQEIENKKKINIVNTAKIYKDDPKGLAKKVNSVLGFEIVLPQGAK